MSPSERLKSIIDYSGMSTNKLATELGYGRSEALYKILRGEVEEISSSLALRVVTKYPEINMDWLLTGRGEMLQANNKFSETQLPYYKFSDKALIEEKSSRSREINEERIAGKALFKNYKIPFYDIEISAGTMNFYQDYPELPHSEIAVPFISDCDLAMPVYGDSMYPKIKNGDVVMLKKVQSDLIMFGEIYLVITEDYRTLKYVRKAKEKDHILLISENEKYDPVQIPKSSILHLFLYKGKFEKSQI